jgi:hypothetical protein
MQPQVIVHAFEHKLDLPPCSILTHPIIDRIAGVGLDATVEGEGESKPTRQQREAKL